ncbi:MAG: molecular chaperone GrpE [Gammaproteobacteria bacterium]|jgi:molecular chaperone GrpE
MSAKKQNENEVLQEEQPVEGELLEAEIPLENEEELDASNPDSHQQELESLKQQVQENLDKAVRAHAELDNVRKRTLRDVENAHKYALEKFANELLPVMDSLELGINAAEVAEEQNTLKEGMDLTLKMFRDVVEKFGVKEVESQGEKFDPEKHEAVSMQEIEGTEPGAVVTVLQKGYTLNGRLIRPAMVIVAK